MYLLLLLIAIGLMIGLRQCSARNLPERSEKVAGGDTINVARKLIEALFILSNASFSTLATSFSLLSAT